MKALLVVNTFATRTSNELREVITAALESRLDINVVSTRASGDAMVVASQEAIFYRENQSLNHDIIISLGGDGTCNEVANGLLRELGTGHAAQLPILAAIPGGNANVYTRNLGFSRDAVTATSQLLTAIDANTIRSIGVGKVSTLTQDRYFLFNAGYGIDAAVVARLHHQRSDDKRLSDVKYLAAATKELLNPKVRNEAQIWVNEESNRTHFAIATNLSPWTYVGDRAIDPLPRSNGTDGLALIAGRSLSVKALARFSRDFFTNANCALNPRALALENQQEIALGSSKPEWLQVDGEPLERTTTVHLSHQTNSLRVFTCGFPHV